MDPSTYRSHLARYEQLIDQEFDLLEAVIDYALTLAPQVTDWRLCELFIKKNGYMRFGPVAPDAVRDDAFSRIRQRIYAGEIKTLTLGLSSDSRHELWATINGAEYQLSLPQILSLNSFIQESLQPHEPEPVN